MGAVEEGQVVSSRSGGRCRGVRGKQKGGSGGWEVTGGISRRSGGSNRGHLVIRGQIAAVKGVR